MIKRALVAGSGSLPFEIYAALCRRQEPPSVYLLERSDLEQWQQLNADVKYVENPLSFGLILGGMRLRGIRKMILAGNVPKRLVYRREQMDEISQRTVDRCQSVDDHCLLGSVVQTVEKFGIQVESYDRLLPELFFSSGLVAGCHPTSEQMEDGRIGFKILQGLLPFSFGQSLTVYQRSVVAVEALEGTDAMILRSGQLVRGGVLVKAMKSGQDRRYDLPVIGLQTVQNMVTAGLTTLFAAAGEVLILQKEQVFDFVKEHGLCLWGLE